MTCRCGANYADQSLEELDGSVFELMKVIWLKVHGLPLGGLKNQCGYPMKDFGELLLSSLLLIMNVLQKQYYKCHAPSAGTHSSAIDASVNVFKNWPHGYHEFLNELGEYYQATRPPESALRKQFELFYLALFKNSSFKKDTEFLKSEFIEFGKGVWGKGHIDKKLLDNQSLTSDIRYLTKSQFCERTGMSPRVLNMIFDSSYINKKTIPRGNGGTRVIIDTRGLLIPDIFIKAVPIREAGASLGVPVSVLKYLKEGLMSTDSLHRGRKETWFVEEVTLLMQSARAHAKPIGFYKQEMVSLQRVLRKKLRSDVVKADIVSAVIEGQLPTETSAGDKLSEFLVDKEKVMALIERHKSRKEQSTMTFPEAAKKLGLDMTVIKDAIEQGMLVSTVVDGRVRITEESVIFCGEKYIALSGLAVELKTSSRLLLRLCETNHIKTFSLKRNSKVGNRGYQSVIFKTSQKQLVLAREAELTYADTKRRKDATLKYENAVRDYFEKLEITSSTISLRGGKPNKIAISKACGFSRHVLYKYPTVADLVNKHIDEAGLIEFSPA